ncbi:MAG: response regulator [gamma proteobacterium symbiont of Taylorina sp.]|nr:response regulator [gamma proteobacterium symbiont of Taylorina sp.]
MVTEKDTGSKPGLSKKKLILIVDDVPDNLRLLSGLLKDKGNGQYKLKVASNGEKALKIAKKEPHPDLVLLDVMMPDMDGYEVCKYLKDDPQTTDIPIIFITANISAEEQQKGLELGAKAYLTKPVDANKLFAALDELLV